MRYRLAILTSTINPTTIAALTVVAAKTASVARANIISITATAGCLDMPVIAQALLQQADIDGLIVLGAVAQGETKHDELVVMTMTQAIVQLSLQMKKPVGFGVIGPGAKSEQFADRTTSYARRAVLAVIRNLDLLRQLR